jgi:membrane protease YdiL (CAAX protease family)
VEAKRGEDGIEGRVDNGEPIRWADAGAEAPAAGRRVPPPEVPGREAPHVGQTAPLWPEAPGSAGDPARPWPQAPAAPAASNAWPPAQPGSAEPGPAASPSPMPPGGDWTSRAAAPGQPLYLPQASWRWPQAIAGLAIGSGPEVLLTLAAAIGGGGSGSSRGVTAGSAALLAVGALILYGWQGLAAWLFSLRTAGRSLALWGFRRPNRAFFWTVPLGLIAVYAVSVVHDIIVRPEQQEIVSQFPRSGAGVALFILVAVIMAPLFEEVVFRGFLFRGFANSWGWVWGALASAGIFGIAHLQLDLFVPLATLGFILAWAYKRTGSLWTCITMHGLFNTIAVLAWAFLG